jgi:TonB family protein
MMKQTRAVLLLLLSGLMAIGQRASSPPLPKHIVGLKYPRLANFAHIAGEVSLEAQIAADGRVVSVRAISGNSLLKVAAKESLEQWQFEPCSPAERECRATVTFVFVLDSTATCEVAECPNDITVDLPNKITVRSQLARAIIN